jgi:hypothetical protein
MNWDRTMKRAGVTPKCVAVATCPTFVKLATFMVNGFSAQGPRTRVDLRPSSP